MTLSSDASWAGKANAHRKKQDREDAVEFGRRVRCRRKALRLSQEQLGERSGLHRTYIGHVERGEVNPTLHNVLLVAQALDIDAAELVRGLRTDIGTAVPGSGTDGAPPRPADSTATRTTKTTTKGADRSPHN